MSNLSFTYPTPDGWVEEVVSKETAIGRQMAGAYIRSDHVYNTPEEAYDDFLSSNCATLTDKPSGKYYESFIKSNN